MDNPRPLPLLIILVFIGVIPAVGTWAQTVPAPADLDQTFGQSGLTTAIFYGNNGVANAGVLQPDGKIVTAGFSATSKSFALARFNADGSLDNSFGMAGKVATTFSPSQPGDTSFAAAVAIQSDLKIVAAGQAVNGGDGKLALVRYLPNGSIDPSFGSLGKVATSVTGSEDRARALAIQSDGKIVAVGSGSQTWALARFNSDGTFDNSFGSAGKVSTIFFGADDAAHAVVIQGDGKIVVAGRITTLTSRQRFALVRYNADGSVDTSFGSGGKVVTAVTDNEFLDAQAFALALQPDGKIIGAGWCTGPQGGTDYALARFNTDGSFDSSFGTAGRVTTDFLNRGNDTINSLVVQPNGKIIAAGFSDLRLSADLFALARYNSDGNLDNSFGTGGKVTTAFPPLSSESSISTVLLQPDGKIVGVGTAGFTLTVALARYLGDSSVSPAPTPTPSPTPLPSPTPTPLPIELLLSDSGPLTNHVAALDSVLHLTDPFPFSNDLNLLKLAIDPNSRITIFVRNLQLQPGEASSEVVVRLASHLPPVDVPAEDVRPVANTDFAQVTFRQPDKFDCDCIVTVRARGQTTNSGVIRLR